MPPTSNNPPDHATPHSLLFLGSLLGLGCATDDASDGTTAGDATTVAADTTSTAGADGEPTTVGTVAPATTSDSGTTTPAEGTTAAADGSSSDSGGELMCNRPPATGPISPACVDYTALRNLCNYDDGLSPECVTYFDATCQYYLEEFETVYGPACVAAWEDYYACLSALPCEQVGPGACEAEEIAIGGACQ